MFTNNIAIISYCILFSVCYSSKELINENEKEFPDSRPKLSDRTLIH